MCPSSTQNASDEKVDILFQNMVTSEERAQLATLIYYPEEKLEEIASQVEDINEWHKITLDHLKVVIGDRVVQDRCDTGPASGGRAHPEHIVVAPLDVNRVVPDPAAARQDRL